MFRPEESNLDKFIRALFYTFFAHVIYTVTTGKFTPWNISLDNGVLNIDIESAWGLAWLFIIALILGCLSGLFKTHDWHMWIARKLFFSNRTSRSSIWIDVFTDKMKRKQVTQRKPRDQKGSYVIVHLNDDRRIYGFPEYFSDQWRDGPVVFLTDADWLEENDEATKIPYPGILITSREIKFVRFYYKGEPDERRKDSANT